jgi:hypothetical protein
MSMELTIIFLKEAYSIAASNNTSTLILQQESIRSFQDDSVASMAFQCHACEEPAKRAADLLCISSLLGALLIRPTMMISALTAPSAAAPSIPFVAIEVKSKHINNGNTRSEGRVHGMK